MPAMRAVAMTSPFFGRAARNHGKRLWLHGDIKPEATATRRVTSLSDTSTIVALPARVDMGEAGHGVRQNSTGCGGNILLPHQALAE